MYIVQAIKFLKDYKRVLLFTEEEDAQTHLALRTFVSPALRGIFVISLIFFIFLETPLKKPWEKCREWSFLSHIFPSLIFLPHFFPLFSVCLFICLPVPLPWSLPASFLHSLPLARPQKQTYNIHTCIHTYLISLCYMCWGEANRATWKSAKLPQDFPSPWRLSHFFSPWSSPQLMNCP